MKPERTLSLIFGIALLVIGALSMVGNLFLSTQAWRMWPLVVLAAGLALTLPGFLAIARPGLGAFFMPGIPVLTVGSILMFASITDNWEIWALAWPLLVLAAALGFGLSAIFMRVPGLAIPAIIIGANGLVLGFCNLTGLWSAWAILWPIEPLAIGLGLLVVGISNRSAGTNLAAMILIGIAGFGFFLTSFVSVFNETILRFAVPGMLVLTGILLVGMNFLRRENPAETQRN
ncbi:MAG: hypothetical protein CVU44_16455 [Chloroflexi bacterium HGW-Chloroflexi-6]|nr:MAG: hypothetical protein CVU44_16455 [Chloroflexi bacterium HGW-Chloroflexi-6]